nr:MAG TPA_asm: hypothetical protein [Caudoviricetes sp.]
MTDNESDKLQSYKKILRNMERVSYIFCIFVSASMSYIINYTLLYSIISRVKQD